MFFDSKNDIKSIASKVGTSIFVVPENTNIDIKNSIILRPEEKSVITIEQIRDVLARLNVRQQNDIYIIIQPAEALGTESANAILKNLEEPGENIHFVLITDSISSLIPTILSRAAIYFLKDKKGLDSPVEGDPKIIDLARKLVVAKPADLPALAEQITKKKDGVRNHALTVLKTSTEILYKSYLKTNKPIFLNKIPKFLKAYDSIDKKGHVKLHLVADLL